jgi:DNA repair photolyase
MPSPPTLFDLGPKPPTTRTIALIVKEAGPDGLTDAVRRADDARYQEVTCRSALNAVKGMPFKWTLNPYRGCTHGCHYCFARRYQTQVELGFGDDFSSLILVKVNFADVLGRELDRPAWQRENVAFGTATDPYQPIEGHYKITRRSLEALVRGKTPIGLITKGPMAVRDRDVLSDLTRVAGCDVCFSVPSVDEEAWRRLEPGTAHPLQRLRAVRELRQAGVNAGVLMAPIVPGITDKPSKLEATVKAIADHDAGFVGANVLHLEGGTREHFLRYLETEYPNLTHPYRRLYRGKYAPKAYVERVRGLIRTLEDRYDGRRRRGDRAAEEETGNDDQKTEEQTVFAWS